MKEEIRPLFTHWDILSTRLSRGKNTSFLSVLFLPRQLCRVRVRYMQAGEVSVLREWVSNKRLLTLYGPEDQQEGLGRKMLNIESKWRKASLTFPPTTTPPKHHHYHHKVVSITKAPEKCLGWALPQPIKSPDGGLNSKNSVLCLRELEAWWCRILNCSSVQTVHQVWCEEGSFLLQTWQVTAL